MSKNAILFFGAILTFSSIVSSIFFGFYFWYSFYVIGAFIFFGSLNWKNKAKTVFTILCEKKYKKFLIIYLLSLIFIIFVDIIYGRIIADLWHYPYLSKIMSFVIPVFIYYPFGGFQVYEIFYFLKQTLIKKLEDRSYYRIPQTIKDIFSYLSIIVLIVGVFLPIANFFLNENKGANELIVIFMILATFSADMIVYRLKKNSILFSFLEGNKLIIAIMILGWILPALLTEYPNTYSWEWVYTMPFTDFEILKINIVVLTFGWLFLVYVPVRGIDLLLYFLERKRGL